MKALTILVSPSGESFFEAYGPMSKSPCLASVFVSPEIAAGAAERRFGRAGKAFWNSERTHEEWARKEYRDWTYEVIPLPDTAWFDNRDGLTRLTPEAAQKAANLLR